MSVLEEKPDFESSLTTDVMTHTFYTIQEQLLSQKAPATSTLDELVAETVNLILQQINVPKQFSREELHNAFTARIDRFLKEEDPELGEVVRDLLEYDDIPDEPKEFEKFVKTFKRFSDKSSSLSEKAFEQSLMYLYTSDIPYSIIAKLALVEYTSLVVIQFLDQEGSKTMKQPGRLGVRLQRIQNFRRLVRRLGKAGLEPRLWATRIRIFIHVANSETLETLFEPKALTYSVIDKQELTRLDMMLEETLSAFRRTLLGESVTIFEQSPKRVDPVGQTLWSEFIFHQVE